MSFVTISDTLEIAVFLAILLMVFIVVMLFICFLKVVGCSSISLLL